MTKFEVLQPPTPKQASRVCRSMQVASGDLGDSSRRSIAAQFVNKNGEVIEYVHVKARAWGSDLSQASSNI